MTERRLSPRALIGGNAWVCELDAKGGFSDITQCRIVDISEGGAKLWCVRSYHAGQVLAIVSQELYGLSMQPLAAVVMRNTNDGLYGVQFLHVSQHVISEIKRLVSELLIGGNSHAKSSS